MTAIRFLRTSLVAAVAVPLLLGSGVVTEGNAANSPALKLISIIPIPLRADGLNKAGGMFSFDISWVDPANGLYYLADRSNAALDVIDTTGAFTGKPDSFFGQIGSAGTFTGDTGSTATSGPDGVVAAFPCIFAGDGSSTLKSFNGAVSFSAVVSSMNTGGKFRVDEMAVDVADGLVLGANNADDPPFSTIFSYNKSTCALSNPIKTLFNALPGGHVATNGIEQPVWDPLTKRFYVSLPEIDGPGDGTGITGAVARITTAGVVETVYPINYCQPAGLTVGPAGDLLVGCNSVFGLDGKKCSAVAAATNAPASCSGVAYPQSAICNPSKGCTGNSLVSVPGAGGGDEVYFNSGDGNYYLTAGNDPKGPLLGVVQSVTNVLTQVIPTHSPIPALGSVAAGTFVHNSGTAHSVAASAGNNHVYVPLPANKDYSDSAGNNCLKGCVAVFSAQ